MKAAIIETMIFYPHYCHDCHCTYVSDKPLAWCWSCHSWNVVNCYGETKAIASPRLAELPARHG